jgi:hypothetical protein
MFLLGNEKSGTQTGPDETGVGYPVGTGLNFTMTARSAAINLFNLNDSRITKFEQRGVYSKIVHKLHEKSGTYLAKLDDAVKNNMYSEMYNYSRNIWGWELRAYPKVLSLVNDAIMSVIFLLVFIAPWAFFMERLIIRANTVNGRILGAMLFFFIMIVILFYIHPAFQISSSPLILLVAYMLAGLASLALSLIMAKYTQVLKKWREQTGGIHSSDISRASTFAVAFNLGITNMSKRPLRTTLTIVMVSLLTFSVITFISVETSLDTRMIPLKGVTPTYNSLFFRVYNWVNIPAAMIETLEQDLGPGFVTVYRNYYQKSEDPWSIGLGVNKFIITNSANDKSAVVEYLQGHLSQETQVGGITTCLVAGGKWFTGKPDEIILPSGIASSLGITAADAASGRVQVKHGQDVFRVIGILDTVKADNMTDISGEKISMVDYYSSGIRQFGQADLNKSVGDEGNIRFMGFDRGVLMPYKIVKDYGGSIKTVVFKFPDSQANPQELIDNVMSRLDVNMFASLAGKSYLVKIAKNQSVQGVWKILLPILLVILIMVNTMLGTVDERKEEIKMLGAVGLAPKHVRTLYLAEASVYGVFGVVFGVTMGLIVELVTRYVNLGLDVNYASLTTMLLAILVLIIVIIATIVPASHAAKLATPSGSEAWSLPITGAGVIDIRLPFTMTLNNGTGIFAFIHEYFSGHKDSTSPDFRIGDMQPRVNNEPGTVPSLKLNGKIWLAPYDIAVSQDVELDLCQVEGQPLFCVMYKSRKLTGELSAWEKGNYVFVDLLRKQFLIFRTLSNEKKCEYVVKAQEIFKIA